MRSIRRLTAVFLVFLFCAGLFPLTASAADRSGFGNFLPRNSWHFSNIKDVTTRDWFLSHVMTVYDYGLMKGKSETAFDPEGGITLAETVTVAARLHAIYMTGSDSFPSGDPWYEPYLTYCQANGIVDRVPSDMNRAATRAEFASLMARALPEVALGGWNAYDDGDIPDVSLSDPYGEAVYTLYRAGILTGNDDAGTFAPSSGIRRCEAAAILCRMIDRTKRVYSAREENVSTPAGAYYLTPNFHVIGGRYYLFLYENGTGVMNAPVGLPEAGDTSLTADFDFTYKISGTSLRIAYDAPNGSRKSLSLRIRKGANYSVELLSDWPEFEYDREKFGEYSPNDLKAGSVYYRLTVRSEAELAGRTYRQTGLKGVPADQIPEVRFSDPLQNGFTVRFTLDGGEEMTMNFPEAALMENTAGCPETVSFVLAEQQMRCQVSFSITDREHMTINLTAFPEGYAGSKVLHSLGRTFDGAVFELVKP